MGAKEEKKMSWAEDTIDEFSLAQHVTGDSFSLLTHGNICIVGFFSDYKKYTYSKNHILQYFEKKTISSISEDETTRTLIHY